MNRVNQLFNELTRGDCGSVTIVHGHGGEKLKSAIRSYLNDSRPDLSFRTGSWPGEGGDGVTIVEL